MTLKLSVSVGNLLAETASKYKFIGSFQMERQCKQLHVNEAV